VFLLGMAAKAYLARYEFLDQEHGFMVGADWVNTNVGIPLQWMSVAAFAIALPSFWRAGGSGPSRLCCC
jgi:uncharacterized membrane protein (UPF0182 family)